MTNLLNTTLKVAMSNWVSKITIRNVKDNRRNHTGNEVIKFYGSINDNIIPSL